MYAQQKMIAADASGHRLQISEKPAQRSRVRRGQCRMMMPTTGKPSRLRFGLFVADLETGELWKASRRIHLQTQPFKVLEILLEHPGEVVNHEDLQSRVWDPGTNVDFDRALAGAINKIRDALGDSAENPCFVETLAKRGYRFIAPVQVAPQEAPASGAAVEAPISIAAEATSQAQTSSVVLSVPVAVQPWRRRFFLFSALFGALAVAFLLGWQFSSWPGSDVSSPVRVEQLTFDSPISPGPPNVENLPSLIAAGNRVLTSILVNGKPQLASISMSSGEIQRINLPQELVSTVPVDISRDGTRLLVLSRISSSSEQPLWVVPTDGGSALRVGNVLAHDAAWMPDGRRILYASGSDLFVISSDGGGESHLTTLPGRAFWLRWSPDGKLLRFTLIDPQRHTTMLWEMKNGSSPAYPLEGLGDDHPYTCCGSWTADGTAFVFQAARPGSTDLWELRRKGFRSSLLQLTNGPLHYFSPVVARNGRRVYLLGSDPPLGLQQFDQQRREFVAVPGFLRNATRVTFSRDAHWVAWTDAEGRLWRAKGADGSEKLQLTPSEIEVFSAAWSPNGSRLALMARIPGQAWQISLINAGGGELKVVSHEPHNAADPTWSADGKFLAFGGSPDVMGKESGPHSIECLELATGKTSELPGSKGLFSPRWSPDGRWIAALTLDQKQIRLFDVQQQRWRDLVSTSAADPVWSSDSKSLLVHAVLADQQPILRILVPSGTIQPVADLSELLRDPPNYFFSGLSPADQPIVLPRVGTSNLYTLDLPN
jgi:Tol biopolymer transport system component/DNA-binding winged helix-turn-helix (wHTH) protein